MQNPFWKDVFSSWIFFQRTIKPINVIDQLSVPLWYNEDISKDMYFANWVAKGILFPVDIFREDGKIMTLGKIEKYFQIPINWLDYCRVKLNLENFIRPLNAEKFKNFCSNAKSKKFYKMINRNHENIALMSK